MSFGGLAPLDARASPRANLCVTARSPDELIEELRSSRTRVVRRAEAEARRIERAIHDGVQQHLVALCVNLQLAEQLLDSDPAAARQLLADIGADVREALESLRELAAGIYPPLLIDRGLADALRGAAREAAVAARVEADVDQRFPSDIEAAVYFACAAALRNVANHAGTGARATVRLRCEPGTVVFEVADDGVGFDARTPSLGAGLTDVRDGVEALGGQLTISSAPGLGTVLRGVLPVPP